MNNVTNITHKMCPFARKVSIVLRQKSSDFKQVLVDLNDKSQFFKESYAKAIGRNPARDGAVPVLIDGDVYLTDSEPVVWYVAEKYQNVGYNVIPEDHVDRFKMRLYIEEVVKKVMAGQSKCFGWGKKSEEDKKKATQQVTAILDDLEKKIALPYALGEQFTVADILMYSHLERWNAIEHFTGIGLQKYEKINQYIAECQKRKSVSELIQSKEAYIEAIQKFF